MNLKIWKTHIKKEYSIVNVNQIHVANAKWDIKYGSSVDICLILISM